MSKATKKAVGYDHITPKLVARVKAVLADAEKHKYSVSRVYGAHNAAFKKNDIPQTCSSCLRNRVRELKAWYKEYVKQLPKNGAITTGEPETPPAKADPNAPEYEEPARGVVRYPMGEGVVPIDFTPSEGDPAKGKVLFADGGKVKAGTYTAAGGYEIAVQPGGKATVKSTAEEDLT